MGLYGGDRRFVGGSRLVGQIGERGAGVGVVEGHPLKKGYSWLKLKLSLPVLVVDGRLGCVDGSNSRWAVVEGI